MSAPEFRALLQRRIDEMLHGETGTEGVVGTIISGAPRDYAVYRDLAGYVRALLAVRDTVIPAVWADLYDPKPKDEQKPTPITTPPGAAP